MRRNRLLTLVVIAAMSIFLVTSGTGIAFREDGEIQSSTSDIVDEDISGDGSILNQNQLIGHEEALTIAFDMADGVLIEFELDEDDEDPIYDIEIIGEEGEYELEIHGYTGEVVEYEEDVSDDFNYDWYDLIGHEEAIDIAFEMANGTLVEFELDEDDDSYIYEIEIVGEEGEYEIEIDAYTGEVLEYETDEDDEAGKERDKDRFWDGTEGRFVSFELLENEIKNYTLKSNQTNLTLFESVMIQDL